MAEYKGLIRRALTGARTVALTGILLCTTYSSTAILPDSPSPPYKITNEEKEYSSESISPLLEKLSKENKPCLLESPSILQTPQPSSKRGLNSTIDRYVTVSETESEQEESNRYYNQGSNIEKEQTIGSNSLSSVERYMGSKKLGIGTYVLVIDPAIQQARIYRVSLEEKIRYPVSTGKVPGKKVRGGDNKTPENDLGESFKIIQIQNSKNWIYHGEHAYGPYFCRIEGEKNQLAKMSPTGKSQIGVHGTNEEGALGTRRSHGCIREPNNIVKSLVEEGYLKVGTPVVIKSKILSDIPIENKYNSSYCRKRSTRREKNGRARKKDHR